MDYSNEFIEAVKKGDLERVEAILKDDATLMNARSEQGVSALLLALYYGREQVARAIAERRDNLDIFEAAALGSADRIEALLETDAELANAFSPDGFQPLGLASFFGQVEAARALLRGGAAVNTPSRNSMRVMPLHSAAAAGYLELCRLLVQAGADVNAVQADEFTPLHAAAQNGQLDLAEFLVENGADVNAAAAGGKTPYAFALESGVQEVIDYLHSLQVQE